MATKTEDSQTYRYLIICGERPAGSPVVRRRYREVAFGERKTKEQIVAYATLQGWLRKSPAWLEVYQLVSMDATPLMGDIQAIARRKKFKVISEGAR